MTRPNKDAENAREFLYAWDPLANTIRNQLRVDLQHQAASLPMKPARWGRRWQMLRLRVSGQPMSLLFALTATLTFVGAVVVIVLAWPVWGHATGEFVGVVVAAGSATAFGSIVFSVTSTSFTRAADIAPGYSVVVLGRRSPWLSGLGIIGVSGLLLAYSTTNPTQLGAIAAVLIAVSAVTWSWMSVRKSLASSDPLAISQEAGRYYRRATRRAAKFARLALARGWPRMIRSDPRAVDQLTRDHQREVVAGLLRQLRAGVRSTAGQGRLTEAAMLFQAVTESFDDYASMVDGEVGSHDGLLEIVLTAADAVIEASIQHQDNEAGNYALRLLVDVGARGYTDSDYSAVRSVVSRRISTYLDRTWDNDTSTIPAASVAAIGDMARRWVKESAFQDVIRELEMLARTATRSLVSRRLHIGYAATAQLATIFPVLVNEELEGLRNQYLKAWSEAVVPVARVAPQEPLVGMAGVADALVPGITLAGGASLQQMIWTVNPSHTAAAADALLGTLEASTRGLESSTADQTTFLYGLANYLALAYQSLLPLVGQSGGGETQAARALDYLLLATNSEPGMAALMSAEVAELAWSIILAASSLGLADATLGASCRTLLIRLAADDEWEPPPVDGAYVFAFVVGLKTITGLPEKDIAAWEETVIAGPDANDPFGWRWDWGLYIDGLGRSPATNRNRATASQSVFDRIDERAVNRWPLLASNGHVVTH